MVELNMHNRRRFIQKATLGGLAFGASAFAPKWLFAAGAQKLTLLHTNDWHSRIEPFPMDGSRYEGLGGAAARAEQIRQIRAKEDQVLLLDSGDFFQGTPYFNYFGGELELKLMEQMGYDATTIGNHDFDGGLEGLAKQLEHSSFPLISSNYDFTNTPLQDKNIPFKIFKKKKLKIGVFGIGIELAGLVPLKLYGETKYLDPIEKANETAAILKHDHKCHLVVCLSHLGLRYAEKKVSDEILAQSTSNIDVILGGHTHTFLPQPIEYQNTENKSVLVNQVGWAGIVLGRLDLHFELNSDNKKIYSSTVILNEKTT